ncbi:MAG: hypothetical protein UY65_C0016G0004 [Parcubacteria group bacterium GW2011_GWA2_51_12]|nr:MAG: hypothetical protein UY65_C0016G0004 [Parcubacteria group bacterium GW2011_GWA2_51_12]
MYFYIFDPGSDKEAKYFEKIQGRLLNYLAEFKVEGETYRVTSIRTVELLVEQALNAEAKTIVMVGSDSSLDRAINIVIAKQADVTLGFIPLDTQSSLGNILGISSDLEEATRTLAGRLGRNLNLGKVGEHFFLTQVDLGPRLFEGDPSGGFLGFGVLRSFMKIQPFPLKLSLEGSYTATSEVLTAQIINCRDNQGSRVKVGDPSDGLLDILLLNPMSSSQMFRHRRELLSGRFQDLPGTTIMHAKKIEILGPKKLPLSVSGQVYAKAPAEVTVAREKVKIIVGKNRQF